MLMLKTTHDRIVADDAKKLGKNAELIAKLTADRDSTRKRAQMVFAANMKLAFENTELRNRLAVFTTPRQRDAKGHFVSAKGVQA